MLALNNRVLMNISYIKGKNSKSYKMFLFSNKICPLWFNARRHVTHLVHKINPKRMLKVVF